MTKIKDIKSFKNYIRNHWLMMLIVLQPILDILAYWTKSPEGTAAGTVRLIIMLALPLYLLFTLKEKKRFIAIMAVIAAVFALHILNCMRVGYVDMVYDVSYAAKTAQMPILAVCLLYLIKNEQTRNQAYWGLFFAAAIVAFSIVAGMITGTANVTYGDGLGVSGWVIDDLRCANSDITVVLAAFAVFCAVKSKKLPVNFLVPLFAMCILLINGTKACYYSAFLILIGFAVFLVIEKLIKNREYSTRIVIALLLSALIAGLAYPLTPVYRVKQAQMEAAKDAENDNMSSFEALGVDLDAMSNEEKLADPEVYEAYRQYYYAMIWYRNPNMFDRFGLDRILLKYDMTTDAETLDNVRQMKRNYASLVWDESDALTKFFGLDVSDLWFTGKVDLENDWTAMFYYYGYIGFAFYCLFVLYFAALIVKRLFADFKSAYTSDNFILLITFSLLVFLAQYSGAVLRRPNVSVYLSVILALIYYQTAVKPVSEDNDLWGRRPYED